jgi:hypothetical protein
MMPRWPCGTVGDFRSGCVQQLWEDDYYDDHGPFVLGPMARNAHPSFIVAFGSGCASPVSCMPHLFLTRPAPSLCEDGASSGLTRDARRFRGECIQELRLTGVLPPGAIFRISFDPASDTENAAGVQPWAVPSAVWQSIPDAAYASTEVEEQSLDFALLRELELDQVRSDDVACVAAIITVGAQQKC